jgi:hypothetical protein
MDLELPQRPPPHRPQQPARPTSPRGC